MNLHASTVGFRVASGYLIENKSISGKKWHFYSNISQTCSALMALNALKQMDLEKQLIESVLTKLQHAEIFSEKSRLLIYSLL